MHTSRAEATPHRFEIKTVQDQGWSGTTNRALLRLAEEQFEVLITSDQNFKHQQNLANRRLSIIQLPTNQVPLVVKLAPKIQETPGKIRTGELIEISLDA